MQLAAGQADMCELSSFLQQAHVHAWCARWCSWVHSNGGWCLGGLYGCLCLMLPAVLSVVTLLSSAVLPCPADGVGINPSQTAGVYAGFKV